MIYDGILFEKQYKKYKVYIAIQDGSEYIGTYSNKGEAVEAYKAAHYSYNRIENKEPSFYEEVQKVTTVFRKIK